MAAEKEDVYCTLLMSDSYLPGAAVLAHSLRDCGTTKKIGALVTPDVLLYNTIAELKKLFDFVIPVERIANPNLENLARLERLDLQYAFTKIALWKQVQFRRIVYIDADVVALRAPDELFELGHSFAAAPDIGWPDIFNTGVMMLSPNEGEYRSLRTLASSGTSFDGADQGLLNEYYVNRPWHRLSFTYNCTPSSSYQYEPAYRHFRSNISMTHFIGKQKPWQLGRHAMRTAASGVYRELFGRWWSVYDRHYKSGQTSALGQIASPDNHVQQFVNDEDVHNAVQLHAQGQLPVPSKIHAHPIGPVTAHQPEQAKNEIPFTAPTDALETLETQPPLVSEQRQSDPPQMAWDATKSAPPAASVAEAGAFPSQKYDMSSSTELFHAPKSYPEPPRDMYYVIPPKPESTQKPSPIFPWEQQAKRPTRVFAEPLLSPTGPPPPEPDMTQPAPIATEYGDEDTSNVPIAPAPMINSLDSFSRINAWDNHPSIDQYVRAVRQSQSKRGVMQTVKHDRSKNLSNVSIEGAQDSSTQSRRAPIQESLILTDFPTELERPSLPVTPAPRERHTFWSDERNDKGELPAADGVPSQSDWNPHERIELLRRSSVQAAEELPRQDSIQNSPPLRAVPETSADLVSPTAISFSQRTEISTSETIEETVRESIVERIEKEASMTERR